MKATYRLARHALMTATCLATGFLCPAGAALGHDGHQHHAAPAGGASDYKRSVREYAIPDVSLTNADARPVRLRDLLETREPVMLNFIFTTCGAICPVMSQVFSEVPGKLGTSTAKLRMVSISIDPENDTPTELKSYGKRFNATDRWQFLTGRVEDVTLVQRAFDNYRGDKMNHEPLTLLRAGPDKPWVRIDGFASSTALAREYRKVVSP
jgi:protein SCO1/2